MRPVPADLVGANNDLNDLLDFFIQQAIKRKDVDIYAFGEPLVKNLLHWLILLLLKLIWTDGLC